MNSDFIFTSESVTQGHPDKLCDWISDAIVGRVLRLDPLASVRAECAIATGMIFIAVRLASTAGIDIPYTARDVLLRAGYDRDGFDVRNCTVMTSVTELDPSYRPPIDERHLGDDGIERIPAGDLATVFGYACDHTPVLMPLPIWHAHKLVRRLSEVRDRGILAYLTPDGKSQVGVAFRGGRPSRIHSLSIVASQCRADAPTDARLRADLLEHVIRPAFADEEVRPDRDTRLFINPTGPIVGGGPSLHSGLTGRKAAVDTYGEFARYSSSALSGKDPSRIERIGSYASRYAAKNVVAAGLARECEVQLSYTIGLPGPVSVQVETFGTGRLPDSEITARVLRHFDFRLAGIVRHFDLRRLPQQDEVGFYERLAAYGHVGRADLDLPWERTDQVDRLQ